MIWTRDAEDSLTYVKSNKKVGRVSFEHASALRLYLCPEMQANEIQLLY